MAHTSSLLTASTFALILVSSFFRSCALATRILSPDSIFRRNPECAAPSRCGRTSDAMLNCDKIGTDETELRRCICTRDPYWETDVLECALCWEAELPNYELGIALDYANKHLCKPGPVALCEPLCTIAWHVLSTCGSASADNQDCICRYKYIWEPWIKPDLGYSCPKCLEGNDEKALADQLRAWIDWPCEAMSPATDEFPDVPSTDPAEEDGGWAGRQGDGTFVGVARRWLGLCISSDHVSIC
ncbi:hypothetical protein B0H66DRAFT_570655 [Apodospora peruviana]|uniref:Uncharacterized protein n=1 Tax=Apodospora peruviana TaxID=516989 RepID=A0AAE0LYL0_9PEZI|nr:hypothetical protein B0H66DRAFT_570655 [Apodospora peruviana]